MGTAAARGGKPSVAELQDELNALRRELTDTREQQTTTADVLKIIGRSAYDLKGGSRVARLCEADMATTKVSLLPASKNRTQSDVTPTLTDTLHRRPKRDR